MRLQLLAIGQRMPEWVGTGFADYAGRMPRDMALTLQALPASVAKIFEELLTGRELDDEQISFMQQTIDETGALAKVERMITAYSEQALTALRALEVSDEAKQHLAALANAVINRAK
jgi:geranylgeranyl diphosphate synthase type I